jgi:hypothetical protein
MKGRRFVVISSAQQTAKRELKAIREEAFSQVFHSFYA